MKNKIIVAGIFTALIAAGCASEKDEQAALQAKAQISKEQAQQIALAKVPNATIKESELEKEHGKLIWSFDVSTSDNSGINEINVDAKTGNIVSVENEKDKD